MPSHAKLRTLLAAAATTLAVAAVPAVSGAALTTTRTTTATPTTTTRTAQLQQASIPTTRLVTPSLTYSAVTAGSTGDGPADDAECDRWAFNINFYLDLANAAAENGNDAEVDRYGAQSAAYEDQAQDRGCFILD